MDELEKHSRLWTKPFYYVVGPIPAKANPEQYGGSLLCPYAINGNGYFLYSTSDHLYPHIVAKMLQAGVRQIDKIPVETIEEYDRHFWTDRLQEYVLIEHPDNPLPYIYQLDPPQYVQFWSITRTDYDNIIQKMLDAGVKVLPEPPKYEP